MFSAEQNKGAANQVQKVEESMDGSDASTDSIDDDATWGDTTDTDDQWCTTDRTFELNDEDLDPS